MCILQWWWIVVLCSLVVTVGSTCPSPETITPCQCTKKSEEIQIWCSQSELSGVLSGLAAISTQLTHPIDELILENNVIPSLPGRAFAPLRVVRLMLRNNKLERLSANWLAGLEPSLLEVFIVEHELKSIPEDAFLGLERLEAVTIKAGHVQRLPSFSGLQRLRYLHTELPALTELSPGRINGLGALEQLHLIASPHLTSLVQSSLQDAPRLTLLNFTECGITWIHPRSFDRLPSLKEIDMTGNHLVDAAEIGRAVRELPHLAVLRLTGNSIGSIKETTFVDIPPLTELYLNNNKITDIHRGSFHRLPLLTKIELSNNKIQRIHPDFFLQSYDSALEDVSLVNNQLDHVMYLTNVLEALPRLRFLDMSQNLVQDIMFGALRGHPTLERLHLNSNLLRRVVREAFSGMPSLRELRLSNNSLSNYLEVPLWNLPNLKGLDLSHNEFRRIDRRVLANLPSLRRLDVSDNNLLIVDTASFLGTSALEIVNLSRNAIDMIHPQTFNHLNNLFELDMSWNKLTSIVPGLPRAVELLHLSNNKISALPRTPSPDFLLPALRLLNLSGNKLGNLPPEALISMPLLRKLLLAENSLSLIDQRSLDGLGRLEQIDFHDNHIHDIHPDSFRDLRRLQELDLSGNRLASVQATLLRENSQLRTINLNRNEIVDIPDSAFDSNKLLEEISLAYNALSSIPNANVNELKALDLSYNRITSLHEPLQRLKSLSFLNLSGNKIETLVEGPFANIENLTVLDLDSNQIQFMSSHVIRSLPSLSSLRLSRNKLSTIPSAAFSNLPALTDIELQENQLSHLASDAFTGVPNLLMMNLSHNHLTSLEKIGLHGVKSLEVLDLSHNKLSSLNSAGIPHLNSLIQLKMDGNNICNIQGSPFNKMTHLRMLSLKNNKLMTISETALQPLRSTIYQMDIEGNPLKCSCTFLWQKTFSQESYQSPICYDGAQMFPGNKMLPDECSHAKFIDLQRACDSNSNGLGTTQQLSLIHTNNWKDTSEKPTPEESEYFYEEYVEYDENVSLPINLTQYTVQTTSTTNLIINPPTTAIPPGVMSHFIPGDTPTLYARPGNDQTKKKPTKPPMTTFSFFGMPLPSLNIGNFWGSSRNKDGQSRFPGARGTIQPIGKPTRHEEGFKPILFNSGGFRPIFNPYENITTSSFHSIKTVPNVTGIAISGHYSTPIPAVSTFSISSPYPVSDLSPTPDPQFHETLNKLVKVIPPKTVPRKSNKVSTLELEEIDEGRDVIKEIHQYTYNNFSHQTAYEYNNVPEMTTERFYSSVIPTPHQFIPPTNPGQDVVYESTEQENNHVEVPDEQESQTTAGNGPSPLSAFLAPGGQLPPFRSSAGKPTITKVTMAPSPIAEEIQAPFARHAKSTAEAETNSFTKENNFDNSKAWYYQNYNKTNLQPYVGPGIPTPSNSSSLSYPTQTIFLTVLILMIQSCRFSLV